MQSYQASVTSLRVYSDARAAEWAEIQEAFSLPLYKSILSCIPMLGRCRLLDLGCGSGAFCAQAASVGLTVTGLDSATALIRIARERQCGATFVVGAVERLRFIRSSFDSITAINAFRHVASARAVLMDARRLVRRGGAIVISSRAPLEHCDAAKVLGALDALRPAGTGPRPDRFALSPDGVLEKLATTAGLTPVLVEDVECPWTYENASAAVSALMASGTGARAIAVVGESNARRAVLEALRPFRDSAGGIVLSNRCRYVMAIAHDDPPDVA
ncbi:MAG: methyltransferase domain-containing protein [Deltaproteobacteria bacterium]|nr:methyltransferase domain-containing protein [Deltaproteobacteria bacterium]